MIEDIQG
jgi:hypothetical protein